MAAVEEEEFQGDLERVGNEFFAGSGELARLMNEFDWSATSLGPPKSWPQSLKTAVRIILTSRFSMWMAWGPDLVFFYNDAYRHDTLGLKHPWALGRKSSEVWAEIWDVVAPRIESVLDTGEATWDEALRLFLERSGFTEETYHTFSYSPLANDEGKILGMICVVAEETDKVIQERRLKLLQDLGGRLTGSRSEEQVLGAIGNSFPQRQEDVPFTLLYLFDVERKNLTLASATGIERGLSFSPETVRAESDKPWPFGTSLVESGQVLVDLSGFGEIPTSCWEVPAHHAVVVSVGQQGTTDPAGFMVIGLNPYRPMDPAYAGFIDLLVGQISSGLSNARANEAERRRAEELAKLDQAKTTFFSNVSHELRTPLTLMLGPLEDLLAESDKIDHPTKARIELAHRNSLRLLKLVNTLLDFSRIEAGRAQANYEPVDFGTLTAEIASNFRSACDQAGLRLIVDSPASDQFIYVDRGMWERVVLNLVSNAIKYTFHGEIAVKTYVENGFAIFQVKDSGTGIPKEAIPRLFERFYRVEGARGRTHEGTGIGLALVQELVLLQGGSVSVVSEQGVGSLFSVRIPIGEENLPSKLLASSSESMSATTANSYLAEAQQWLKNDEINAAGSTVDGDAQFEGSHILIADDNADLRDYLQHLLSPRYFIQTVSDGAQALEAARAQAPDLILTDVMMPVLDGFELLRAIRSDENLREVPVIVLSARAGEEAKVEGLEFGADDYLVKPFSARELSARIHSNLELSRLRKLSAIREAKLRKSAEEAFQKMQDFAESLPQMVAERDSSGTLTWANNRLYEYSGIDHRTLQNGQFSEMVHVADRDRFDAFWDADPESENSTIEVQLRRQDGVYRWWLVAKVAIKNADGSIDRTYGSATDIHDQKEAEIELEFRVAERTAELLEANREMEGFTYTVSHDLRSPLRSIIFNSGLLLEELGTELAPDHRELLERQMRSARKLANLIDDLLKLSRVSRTEMKFSEVDLSGLAAQITEQSLQNSANNPEVRIQPGMVASGDRLLLEFVLLNLIENAIKFSPGGGSVEIGVEELEGQPTFFVKDSGVGFDQAYSEKIFQPFERLVSEDLFPGTGIGLANVKRIVERHRGKAWAKSTPGQGATFYFTIPSPKPE